MLACLLRYAWWRVISCTWTEAWTNVSLCLTRASALGRDTESWHFTPQESTVCILGLCTASRRRPPYRRDSKVARLPILLLRTAKSRGEIIVVVDLEHVWKSESVCLSCEEVWDETCFPVLHLSYAGQCVDIHPENVTMRCTPEQSADGESSLGCGYAFYYAVKPSKITSCSLGSQLTSSSRATHSPFVN